MPSSRRFGRSRFTLLLLVLASLTILTLDYRDTGPIQGVRGVVGTAYSPFRGVGDAIASPFRNGWNGIFAYDELEDENEELREQIDEMRGERVEDDNAREENDELRRLADLAVPGDIDTVVAEVIQGPLTSFDSTLEVNRGSGDGIKKGMAVVTDAGLVGRVLRVTGGRARIQLITDPDLSGFGVKLVEARDVGIAMGGDEPGTLVVREGIQDDTPVERGDDLVTSGYGRSAYPGGIPVGTVVSVGRTSDRTEQSLVLDPIADLEGLGFVAVLLCDQDCG